MTATALAAPEVPSALHRGEEEIPFIDFGDMEVQLLQVDVEAGLWVVRTRMQPGTTLQRHKHTGEVFALTFSGAWKYLEYPEVNRPGSYLYEPAGSIHTLHVPEEVEGITDVWFAVRGANLNLDAEGKVESYTDASTVRDGYLAMAEQRGLGRPPIIGL